MTRSRRAALAGVGCLLSSGCIAGSLNYNTDINSATPASQTSGTQSQVSPEDMAGPSPTATSRSSEENRSQNPMILDGLSAGIHPKNEESGRKRIRYDWSYSTGRRKFSPYLTLKIPKDAYASLKQRSMVPTYGTYASDRLDDQLLSALGKRLKKMGENADLSDRQVVDLTVDFIQGMKYTQDKPATGYNEYPKYPLETLYDRGGDCEDTSILAASLLREMGYGTVLLKIPGANHMAAAVKGSSDVRGSSVTYRGEKYFYIETTGSGWSIGETPSSVEGESTEILPVNSRPVVSFTYNFSVPKYGKAISGVALKNHGEGAANNCSFRLQIETKSRGVVVDKSHSFGRIASGNLADGDIKYNLPSANKMRASGTVKIEGDAHEQHITGWKS